MIKDPMLRQIIKIATFIAVFVGIIFLISAYWYYSLIIGWLFGAILAIFSFSLKIVIMNNFFKRNITKSRAFLKSMVHTFAHFVIFGVALIAILEINYAYSGKIFFIEYADASVVNKPINLFAFIGGMHVIMAAIFVSHIIQNRKTKKEKQNGNI